MALEFTFYDDEFNREIRKLSKEFESAAKTAPVGKAVFLVAETLRGDSTDIVPFDRGFNGGLASTANSLDPRRTSSGVESGVSYNKDYAVKVHEDMTLRISQEKAVKGQRRQQKYLEKPMKENAQKYGKLMADAIRTFL